ncbi:hypothetical protein GLAREA_11549 [Glarea lozoyensis ATCC 20868]|uniref:Uncharacterized protein n=2 Tax=Glarea lozoyensis TaxID=101852 RepID=S3DE84_GLAL2|nr:uncharacterized protein GLAREA_11549 [Glarea lozoyensis ATCC 20868]EHL01390.1 hypothetical protein M7I_2604 [Glarea lozoyensis 74030]EPE24968.1 hypothetical protein GLAREA_11549 [Glarea lozoyensis ATCC 20868]
MSRNQQEDEVEEEVNPDDEMTEDEARRGDNSKEEGAGEGNADQEEAEEVEEGEAGEIDSDDDMDESEEFDENLIPEEGSKNRDLTLDDVDKYIKAYNLEGIWGDSKNWAFYSGQGGSDKIRAFQEANVDMEGGKPVSFHDLFSKSFKNHVLDEVDDDNLWKADAMLSYYFGLMAQGTIHVLLPKNAHPLKPYPAPKLAYWYLYELPGILRKGGRVRRIVRYDAKKPDEDEGKLVWERGVDHEGPKEPPRFEVKP